MAADREPNIGGGGDGSTPGVGGSTGNESIVGGS